MTKPFTNYIKPNTRNLLWAISAGRCHICNEPVYRDWLTKTRGNFGEIAHIIGNRLDLPGREKASLAPEYCNDLANLMLLCATHHELIDLVAPEAFPDKKLRQIKISHEERIEKATGVNPENVSHIVKYGANIGNHNAIVSLNDAKVAMLQNGWYHASDTPIRLGINNSIARDNQAAYWEYQAQELEGQFARNVRTHIGSGGIEHFSVFALAPIPLLIKLGHHFSDINRVEVYQLHREPQNWSWQPSPIGFEYLIEAPESNHPLVALSILFSATITPERVEAVLQDQEFSLWTMTIPEPNNDFLKSREQLQQFREKFRLLLNQIKAKHGESAEIHIFPAVPVSVAVEIGRVRQPKADLPYVVYDQNRTHDGFIEALRIGFEEGGK